MRAYSDEEDRFNAARIVRNDYTNPWTLMRICGSDAPAKPNSPTNKDCVQRCSSERPDAQQSRPGPSEIFGDCLGLDSLVHQFGVFHCAGVPSCSRISAILWVHIFVGCAGGMQRLHALPSRFWQNRYLALDNSVQLDGPGSGDVYRTDRRRLQP